MRTIFFFTMTLLTIVSCTSYKEFVAVQNKNNIPDGTQAIILTSDIETVKQAFKNKGIMLSSMEGGFKTEEIFLDEGTRAMYKAHTFDNQVKVTAFWGITQKVKSNIVAWAGADAASAYDVNAWEKVIYEQDVKRPKRVFDYAAQIIEESHLQYEYR